MKVSDYTMDERAEALRIAKEILPARFGGGVEPNALMSVANWLLSGSPFLTDEVELTNDEDKATRPDGCPVQGHTPGDNPDCAVRPAVIDGTSD